MNIKEAFQEFPLAKITVLGIILLWFSYSILLYSIADKPDKEQESEKNSVSVQVHYFPKNDKTRLENNALPSVQVSKTTFTTTQNEQIEDSGFFKTVGDNYGAFGDSFGALNTLFSGLAFTAVFFSLMMQSRALKETKRDFNEQQKEIKMQNFANQFHAMMEERRFRIEHLKIYTDSDQSKPKEQFRVFKEYNSFFKEIAIKFLGKTEDNHFISSRNIEGFISITNHFFSRNWKDYEKNPLRSYAVGNYFNLIFSICHFINSSNISNENKLKYKQILIEYLTPYEVAVLLIFGLCNLERKKIIEDNQLLSSVYSSDFKDLAIHYYEKEAFGNNSDWLEAYESRYQLLL